MVEATAAVGVELARRVLGVVDCGLTHGLGEPEPGKMCVEAAVCYAMGLPHSDAPTCVHPCVRQAKIYLNDLSCWRDRADRAAALRKLAVAQLGSSAIDLDAFREGVGRHLTRLVLPRVLRAVAGRYPEGDEKSHLLGAAAACESAGGQWRDAASAAKEALGRRKPHDYGFRAGDVFWYAEVCAGDAREAALLCVRMAGSAVFLAGCADAEGYTGERQQEAHREMGLLGCEAVLEALRDCGSPGVAYLGELGLE